MIVVILFTCDIKHFQCGSLGLITHNLLVSYTSYFMETNLLLFKYSPHLFSQGGIYSHAFYIDSNLCVVISSEIDTYITVVFKRRDFSTIMLDCSLVLALWPRDDLLTTSSVSWPGVMNS